MTRVYDWRPGPDERNREYPIRTLLSPTAVTVKSKNWRCVPRLDQGSEGACVGFGWAHTLAAVPSPRWMTSGDASTLYGLAKTLDDEPGEGYEGTSTLGGAKAALSLAWIVEYRWAFTAEDVLATLAHVGPVVLGCWWYAGMEEPDAEHRIRVSGEQLGGHCVCVHGVRISDQTVKVRNSWGNGWGKRGDCFLSWDDLALLIERDGEVCVPVKA